MMNIGIIGASVRGMFLMSIAHDAGHQLVAVADPSDSAGKQCVEIFTSKGCKVKHYKTDRDMLENEKNLDAVIIGSSDCYHHSNLMVALDYNVPIYCEKPMVQTVGQCNEVLLKWQENPVIFCGGLEMRYSPLFMKVKEIIEQGKIGTPFLANAYEGVPGGGMHKHPLYRVKKTGRSLLLQKGVHDIDLLNWFVGEPDPVSVYGTGGLNFFGAKNRPTGHSCNPDDLKGSFTAPYLNNTTFNYELKCPYADEVDMEDNYSITTTYKNGCRSNFSLIYNSPDYYHEFLIIGTAGKLTAIYRHKANTAEIRLMKNSDPENEYIIRPALTGGHGGGDTAIVQDFIDSISQQKQPKASIQAVYNATIIAAGAQDSVETKKVINLNNNL